MRSFALGRAGPSVWRIAVANASPLGFDRRGDPSHTGRVPSSPQNTDEAVEWMRKHFQAEASEGIDAVYEFEVSGDDGGVWHATVSDGMGEVRFGHAQEPSVRFRIRDEDCWALLAGRENADLLYLAGRLEVEGDLSLALKMRTLFRAPE